VGERAGILDLPAATKITGARFAVLQELGSPPRARPRKFLSRYPHPRARLPEILPPFLVNTRRSPRGPIAEVCCRSLQSREHRFWLTPTSEVELHNLYRDETIPEEKLPIHVTAWTACFRSEAGAAGKDTRGILRQHQFQKVELFKFTHPQKSYEEHEALLRNAETILQKLGLHYRTMLLCTGDMGLHHQNIRHRSLGCLRAANFEKSLPARTAKPSNRGAPVYAISQRAVARATLFTRSTALASPSAALGSLSSRIISKQMARS